MGIALGSSRADVRRLRLGDTGCLLWSASRSVADSMGRTCCVPTIRTGGGHGLRAASADLVVSLIITAVECGVDSGVGRGTCRSDARCRSGGARHGSGEQITRRVGTHPIRTIASASVWLVALGARLSASWTLAGVGSAQGSNGRSPSEVAMFEVVRRSSGSVAGSPQIARHAASRSDDAVIASASPASAPAAEASRSRSSRPIAERRAKEPSPCEMAAGLHGTLASVSRDATESASRGTASPAWRDAVASTARGVAASA